VGWGHWDSRIFHANGSQMCFLALFSVKLWNY